ncbi:hypothetical protein Afil01_47260 [Actinorhabdospora filicis]|uniref:Uncharacterized protein n=1 Tax=Actinorhabdospora filicis TaxID=1785913 RepID=A0A9W6SN19_9ACTN|nr:hypothetical protein [Actinorhabdospora filicis]GLZ79919.1 hypothetical protein Afil01_47260 [Actinorhabdospora filicis]
MTYPPQQPDEASSEDTQSLRAREQEQPVSPFGPAPDPHQQGRPPQPPPVPVDPFAPPPQFQQPQQPQYQQPQPQYPQQQPVPEPPTAPNQYGAPAYPQAQPPQAQPPQTYPSQTYPPQTYGQTPEAHAPYAPPQQQPQHTPPPVSAPPAYTPPPVSGPPAAYMPPPPPVSAPPAYAPPQPPVSGPPSYTPPSPYAPPPVSAPPAYTPPPVSAPPSPYAPPPVSAPPVSGGPVSGGPVSGVPVSAAPTSVPPAPPVYVPQQPIYVPQNQPVDPSAFAPKPVDTQGPTYTGLTPEPQPQPQPWGGAPVRERRGMPRWLLVTGVIVLVLALAGGAYLFVRAGKGGTQQADPTPTGSTPPPGPQLTPVTSTGTRLEYLTAGAPWATLAAPPPGLNEITSPVGETKPATPVPSMFVVGGLDTALVPYAGTAKMGETASALAESLDGRRYVGGDNKPLPGLKRDVAPTIEPLRLDGRIALIMRYHVAWDGGGDQVTIVVADMDGARAAVMYAAVPDTEKDLQATVAGRVMTLHFNL